MSLEAFTSVITTAGLPERERFSFWRRIVGNPSGLDIEPISQRPFFGEVTTTRVKDFVFTHFHSQEMRCGWIRQARREEVLVALVLRGKSRSMQDGREIELEPGDFLFVDTTRPFLATMRDEHESLCIIVPREVWVSRAGSREQITAMAVRGNTYLGGLVSSFFRQLIPGIATVEPAMACQLAETLLDLVKIAACTVLPDAYSTSGRISLLCRARKLIEEDLEDPMLDTEKIARSLKISKRYLQELFQEQGTTMCNWMWDRRVEKCRQSLSDPLLAPKSVSAIAFGWGFSNFAHFSSRFKAAFSISPSEFRRAQLASQPRKAPLIS